MGILLSMVEVVMDKFVQSFCSGKLAYTCISMTDEGGGADSGIPSLRVPGLRPLQSLKAMNMS